MAFYLTLLLTCLSTQVFMNEAGLLQKRTGVCVCPPIYQPVCAQASGRLRTYSSSCDANCADASVVHGGTCLLDECRCPRSSKTVCGSDNVEYQNECFADCVGVSVQFEGECLFVNPLAQGDHIQHHNPSITKAKKSIRCSCTDFWDPVCGSNDRTYASRCQARCAGVTVAHEGECSVHAAQLPASESCVCTMNFSPVCDPRGNQYSNSCVAQCAGVREEDLSYPPCVKISHHGV